MNGRRPWKIPILSIAAFLAGCASSPQPPVQELPATDRSVIPRELPAVADHNAYRRMVAEAREWQRRAASVEGEWRDVEPLLREAEQAALVGDYRRATELAESARFQAEMGYRQMDAQREVGNPPYLYY